MCICDNSLCTLQCFLGFSLQTKRVRGLHFLIGSVRLFFMTNVTSNMLQLPMKTSSTWVVFILLDVCKPYLSGPYCMPNNQCSSAVIALLLESHLRSVFLFEKIEGVSNFSRMKKTLRVMKWLRTWISNTQHLQRYICNHVSVKLFGTTSDVLRKLLYTCK